ADSGTPGTTVAGVDIGGLLTAEAVNALAEGLGPRADEPLTVRAGASTSTHAGGEAGLSPDSAGTVEGLAAFTLELSPLLQPLSGRDAVPPVLGGGRVTGRPAVG
ncbi:vanomycin resistance protein VanB, partial [Isoptericola sp. MSP01]